MADLVPLAQDVQRVLPLEDLLHQVGHHVAHGQLDVSGSDLLVARGAFFPDADALKGPDYGIRQFVLLEAPLAKYSQASFWKP